MTAEYTHYNQGGAPWLHRELRGAEIGSVQGEEIESGKLVKGAAIICVDTKQVGDISIKSPQGPPLLKV